MSGICGIVYFDGTTVQRKLLEDWTAYLAYRGGDGSGIWQQGGIGLGHTLLRTTREAARDAQPYSLDGETYIIADARLDDRETLARALKTEGIVVNLDEPDVVLLLQAYRAWEDRCLDYLFGDFTFALWDGRKQRLFCARDRFGVKPFFYALTGKFMAFSNTLNCLRLHPEITDELNELAIADFLIFDTNQDLATTTFKQIQRLEAAHCLSLAADGQMQQRQYWQLALPPQIRYRHEADYIEPLRHYLGLAIGDRARQDDVAVFLSGGLDSTAIAATALDLPSPPHLHAFTVIYNHLIDDNEREYAQAAATQLNIPIHFFAADDYALYQHEDTANSQFPEPQHAPLAAVHFDWLRQVARHSRVALYGQGGDEAVKMATVSEALRGMPWQHVLADVVRCWFGYGVQPPWGTGLRNLVQKAPPAPPEAFLPPWLAENFVRRYHLRDRVAAILAQYRLPLDRPPRSRAYQGLPPSPLWNLNFETYDPGVSGIPVDVRLPFLDLRLLNYLLAVPPLPWCVDKTLLRLALRDRLPAKVCQRPKTPLVLNPAIARLNRGDNPWQLLSKFDELDAYVRRQKLQEMTSYKINSRQAWNNLRPIGLGYWLHKLQTQRQIPL
jgi:asparagine synthase (glutamine-hydrolysing)